MFKLAPALLAVSFLALTPAAAWAGKTYAQAEAACANDDSSLVPSSLLLKAMEQIGAEIPADWYWSADEDPACNPKSCHIQVHSRELKLRTAPDESLGADGTVCYGRRTGELRFVFPSGQWRLIHRFFPRR